MAYESTRRVQLGSEKAFQEIFKPAFEHPDLASQFDVMTGVTGEMVITIPEFKKRGFRSYSAPRTTETISGRPTIGKRTINPTEVTCRMHLAPQEVYQTVYAQGQAVDPKSTQQAIYNTFITQMTGMTRNDSSELAWWGDKSLTTPAGDLAFFTSVNGLWKRLETGVSDGDITRRNIASLNGSAISAANAVGVLEDLRDDQTDTMDQIPDSRKVYMVTRTIYNGYKDYLKGLGTEQAHTSIVNGIPVVMFDGFPVMKMSGWDIRLAETAGAANQHRAMLTDRMNLKVAGDTFGPGMKVWFSDDDDEWKSQMYMKMDTNWVHNELTIVAY